MAEGIFQVKKDAKNNLVFAYKDGDNAKKNEIGAHIVKRLNNSTPGQYQQVLTQIQNKYGENVLKNNLNKQDITKINSFYRRKNVSQQWDSAKAGAKPPVGEFDANYYKEQVPNVVQKWNEANKGFVFAGIQLPNIDITERYADINDYLQYDYTTQGKAKNIRANKAEVPDLAQYYREQQEAITDAEKELYRDSFIASPEIQETIAGYVNVKEEQKFDALRRDVLKETISKLNQAKAQEQELDFFKQMPGISEVYDFGSNLSNELLGDSGLGGYLGMMGQGDIKESIENIFSPASSVTYNWQEWFDNKLVEKYSVDTSDGKVLNIDDKDYQLNQEFAKNFINDYLKPRFDYSRSMNEFVSYVDVSNDEQNILQTQTVSNKLKELSLIQSRSFLNRLQKGTNVVGFDSNYYFNPENNPEQQEQVKADWDTAKAKGNTKVKNKNTGEVKTWNQWAYQYGLDLNKKEDFAKLHYQVVGSSAGFDPARNKPDPAQVSKYLVENILPAIAEEAGKNTKNVFLDFVPVESYVESLTEDYVLEDNDEMKALLEENGIDTETLDQEQIAEMFSEVLRTYPAEQIRMQIKQLNEKRKKPTQKLLGVGYIEREEDYKPEEEKESENAIYKIFKDAGYQGDEEEFKSFIGEDYAEQSDNLNLINELSTSTFDFSDPFKALTKIQKLSDLGGSDQDSEAEYNKIFGEAEQQDTDFMSSLTGNNFDVGSFFF